MNTLNLPMFRTPIKFVPVVAALAFAIFGACQTNADWQEITNPVPARIWAADGGDKITREEHRAYDNNLAGTTNSVWDGSTVSLFGARNEVVSFVLIIEASDTPINGVTASFDTLNNGEYTLSTTDHSATSLFDWNNRPIEVFAVEYLRIHGLSRISYDIYDESHTPKDLQRPYVDNQPVSPAIGIGTWQDRPKHDQSYPDIAVPQEIARSVNIAPGESQMFWVDIYLPKDTPRGALTGSISIAAQQGALASIPVEVEVYDITLPDERASKTMLYIESQDIRERYFTGETGQFLNSQRTDYRNLIDRHFMMAWRHGVSLIDANQTLPDRTAVTNRPNIDWRNRLSGGLYTSANGYSGPGQDMAHDVFSIGTYNAWTYWWGLRDYTPRSFTYDPSLDFAEATAVLRDRTDFWETWFQNNAPDTERFLYVEDEPGNALEMNFTELAANSVTENPGIGSNLKTFVTANAVETQTTMPSPDIVASLISVAQEVEWDLFLANSPHRELYMYNGRRPASGTFATEDDGVALREIPWGQYKKGVKRWFYWHGTYYNNNQGGAASRDLTQVAGGEGHLYRSGSRTNVFKSAHTFGAHTAYDNEYGEVGYSYGNGDGVLFYPGTDLVFPDESYDLLGPIASLRLKHWRRGIQDIQYITLANEIDPIATQAIVDEMVPTVLWEVGVADPADPTFLHEPPSWSTNSDDWEAARKALANIIVSNLSVDTEADGFPDDVDNCPLVENPDQLDSDNDGFGNRCDADLNNDCIVDLVDFGIFRSLLFTDTAIADIDGDGTVGLVDFGLFRSMLSQPVGPGTGGLSCN